MFVSNILLGVVALIALATSEKSTSFASVFPNQHALKSGQKATLLIGFKNIAQIQQKIVSVKGYFTSKSAFDKISFNISEFQYESTVDQGDEITIPYPFIPFMEPGSVGLVVLVSHYDHSETLSTSVAFQDLITIVASDSFLFLYAIGLACLAGLAYLYYPQGNKTSKKGKVAKVVKVEADAQANDDDDWIPDHLKKSK